MRHFIKRLTAFVFSALIACSGIFASSWYVCLGSFKVQENAYDFAREAVVKGINVLVYEHQSQDKVLYRVLYDKSFSEWKSASDFKGTLLSDEKIQKLNLNGIWVLEADLEVVSENPVPVISQNHTETPVAPVQSKAIIQSIESILAPEPAQEESESQVEEQSDFEQNEEHDLTDLDEESYFEMDDDSEEETDISDQDSNQNDSLEIENTETEGEETLSESDDADGETEQAAADENGSEEESASDQESAEQGEPDNQEESSEIVEEEKPAIGTQEYLKSLPKIESDDDYEYEYAYEEDEIVDDEPAKDLFDERKTGPDAVERLYSYFSQDDFPSRKLFDERKTGANAVPTSGRVIVKQVKRAPEVFEEATSTLSANDQASILFSPEKPFSVLVRSFKSEEKANIVRNRLKNKDMDAFVLKTYNDDNFFSFDVCAGSFEEKEQADFLKEELNDSGIKNTSVIDYNNVADSIQKYDQVIAEKPVVYGEGLNTIPDVFSDSVAELIRQFPVNNDFDVKEIHIYDFDNMRICGDRFQNFVGLKAESEENQKIHSASYSIYYDNLYGKNISIYIESSDRDTYKQETEDLELDEHFSVRGGVIDAVIEKKDSLITLKGYNANRSMYYELNTSDYSKYEFQALLEKFNNNSGLLAYPQLRKTLLVLPNQSEEMDRVFRYFDLTLVDNTYAQERHNALWAQQIVGHWRSSGTFSQDNKTFMTAFFDMDYDYNAIRNQGLFNESHSRVEICSTNHSAEIYGSPAWYVSDLAGSEFSFTAKTYIIAVNAPYKELTESQLKKVGEDLQIWGK